MTYESGSDRNAWPEDAALLRHAITQELWEDILVGRDSQTREFRYIVAAKKALFR